MLTLTEVAVSHNLTSSDHGVKFLYADAPRCLSKDEPELIVQNSTKMCPLSYVIKIQNKNY